MRRHLWFFLVAAVAASAVAGSAAAASAPSNTNLPTISGTTRDGQLLTAHKGGWSGSPTSFAYAWQSCDGQGGNCRFIAGATSRQYTVSASDVGHRLRVVVTASNARGSGMATSQPTSGIASSGDAPANRRLPTLEGATQQGSTLTVDRGRWVGTAPIRFDYTWQRCDRNGNNCITFIAHNAGATSYTLGVADVGHTMKVEVTAYNAHGTGYVYSRPTGVVGAPTPPATTIAIANVSLPDRLVIDKVSFSPNPVTSHGTITARFHVSDTKGLSVQGALVYALGLPYGWTYNAPEQPTDPTGWATITITPTRNMPLGRGHDLVLFVRARKPGDNLLAGVSTRRLVQEGIGQPPLIAAITSTRERASSGVESCALPVDVDVDVRARTLPGLAQAIAQSGHCSLELGDRVVHRRRLDVEAARQAGEERRQRPGRWMSAISRGSRPRPTRSAEGSSRSRSSSRLRRRREQLARARAEVQARRVVRVDRHRLAQHAEQRLPAAGHCEEGLQLEPASFVCQTVALPSGIVRPCSGASGTT